MNLYFKESTHKYFDDDNQYYTSVTTLIDQYKDKFDVEFWSKAKGVERFIREKLGDKDWDRLLKQAKANAGKNAWKILTKHFEEKYPIQIKEYQNVIKAEWKKKNTDSLIRGNEKHNYFEDGINDSLGFEKVDKPNIGKVITVKEIVENPWKYKNNQKSFKDWVDKYPYLVNRFNKYIQLGYTIFSEIVTYNPKFKVCGMIDVPIFNFRKKTFIIEDWKTNIGELNFTAGYYKKENGISTTIWIDTEDKLKFPLNHLQNCKGILYILQLSLYAYMTEILTGFICEGLYINHIPQERLITIPVSYLKEDIKKMLNHHNENS